MVLDELHFFFIEKIKQMLRIPEDFHPSSGGGPDSSSNPGRQGAERGAVVVLSCCNAWLLSTRHKPTHIWDEGVLTEETKQ